MKKNTTVWGAVIRVNDEIVPHDIPAVAVEINKSSELITEKLSRVFYTVYTDTDTPVSYTHLRSISANPMAAIRKPLVVCKMVSQIGIFT